MTLYNVNVASPGYVGPVELAGEAVNSCRAIMQQAVSLANDKKMAEAIDLVEQATEKYPRWTPLYQLLVEFYLETKQPERARQGILRMHELGHKDPIFSTLLGAVWMGKRQIADAILSFREAQALGAPPGEWRLILAEALLRTGRLEEADALLEDLQESMQEQRSRMFVARATVRIRQKRYQEAVNYALEALRAKPTRVTAFYLMGLALMRKGEHEGAIHAFEEYARLAPHRVAPFRWLERFARKAGDDDQADDYNLKARDLLEGRRLLRMEKQRHAAKK